MGVTVIEKGKMKSTVAGNKTVAIDFTASWCGPCKMIGPYFKELSDDSAFSKIEFCKLDVDENDEDAAACGISAMPTFQIYKNGEKVDELVGASKDKLKEMLQKYC